MLVKGAPDDALWYHKSPSSLVQVIAGCLMSGSHYLHQY